MKALYFERFGGPEVLTYGDIPDPAPSPGHALVKTAAIGLNFADVYRRRGNYHLAGKPPFVAGYEAAGVVAQCGEGAPPSIKAGSRVAFADSPFANAELVSVAYDKLVVLPDGIDFTTAAAVLLQGLTAQYLIHDSYAVLRAIRPSCTQPPVASGCCSSSCSCTPVRA